MKKVLFTAAVNPDVLAHNLYAPLWPAYLAAYAEQHLPPQSVEFHWDVGPIAPLLDRHRPDVLAISSVTHNYGYAEQYAREARKRGIGVIIGGPHISCLPQSLTPAMAAACIGEGEQTFVDLLQLFLATGRFDPTDLERIPGIAFAEGQQTGPRPTLPKLDDLPHPKRALIGYGYRAYVHTARGCVYKCVFCATARLWGKIRYASADYILEELDELVSRGVRVVRFADDDFISNLPRLREISEKVQRRGFHKRLRFSCWCRANHVTPEVVRTLRAMSVVSVKFGLESGSQRILDYLKGGVTVEQNRRAVVLMKEAGMQVNADFIIGAPDETEAEMLETYKFIRKSPIDFFDVNVFSPLPNTPVWDLAQQRGLVNDKGMDWSRLNYKFVRDKQRAIHLSERLTHGQLEQVNARFERLRRWRNLQAVWRSPWLNELPMLALRASWLALRRCTNGVLRLAGTQRPAALD